MEKAITLPNMMVFFLLPEIARSGTSDEVVSSRACKASVATKVCKARERKNLFLHYRAAATDVVDVKPLADCHDRADAADAEGVTKSRHERSEFCVI